MEIAHTQYKSARLVSLRLLCILLALLPVSGIAQPLKGYAVLDGKQYITLSKALPLASLDSFITQYDLEELGLKHFIRTGRPDSLQKMGWSVEINNKSLLTINKPLFSLANNSPADRIRLTERGEGLENRFPAVSAGVRYGYNRFRNVRPFEVSRSVVRFVLKGYANARTVYLSGSFNNWSPDAVPMTKTAEGWIVQVPLQPGKYWYKFVVDGDWQLDADNRLRENDGLGNTNSVYFRPNTVFTLQGHGSAKKVFVAGNFNDWRPAELQMIKTTTGWELPLYLGDGTHLYKYVVDGKWIEDERQKERLPDGHGSYNSVYRIGTPKLFTLKGFTSAKQVFLSGSFNDWREEEVLMRRTATGWEVPYTLGAGNYEYKFKVDEKWITDPANPLTAERDGKINSYLIIGANHIFRLKGYPNAKTIYIAGDFNNWSPASLAMKRIDNEWVFPVHLAIGKHLYKYNVDGEWIIDPGNKLWEQNEHGTGNSVIWIDK